MTEGERLTLSDEEMREIVVSAKEIKEASETLVARANQAGGTDNITVLLAKVSPA